MKKIMIEGMSCEHCVANVKRVLEELGGKNITVNLDEGFATGLFDCSDAEIIAAVSDEGYDVTDII